MSTKRFRRTKKEIALGLSPEDALQERLNSAPGGNDGPKPSNSTKGNITIKIKPAAKTDSDYFKRLTRKPIEIVLDEKWFAWLDTKLEVPYNGDISKLLKNVLNMGIGEVLTQHHFESDIS